MYVPAQTVTLDRLAKLPLSLPTTSLDPRALQWGINGMGQVNYLAECLTTVSIPQMSGGDNEDQGVWGLGRPSGSIRGTTKGVTLSHISPSTAPISRGTQGGKRHSRSLPRRLRW